MDQEASLLPRLDQHADIFDYLAGSRPYGIGHFGVFGNLQLCPEALADRREVGGNRSADGDDPVIEFQLDAKPS